MNQQLLRLNRFLASNGFGARRKVEALIHKGRVSINGVVTTDLSTRVRVGVDRVMVDGKIVRLTRPLLYRYYKPRGVVSSLKDERGRRDLSLVAAQLPRGCVPAGRLDRQSEGLLLWSNNGDWLNALTNPRKGLPKVYRVTVAGSVNRELIGKLEAVHQLPDGTRLRWPMQINVVERRRGKTLLEVVLREGKRNQIREIFADFNLDVLRLVRVEEAGISSKGLRPGEFQVVSDLALKKFLQKIQADDCRK